MLYIWNKVWDADEQTQVLNKLKGDENLALDVW